MPAADLILAFDDPNTATAGQFAHGYLSSVSRDAAAGVYASTPDAAAFSHATQLDFDIDVAPDVIVSTYSGSATAFLAAKLEGAGQRSWDFGIDAAGKLSLRYSSDGTTVGAFGTSTVTLSTVMSARQRVTFRVKANGNDGAGNRWVEFYVNGALFGARVTTAGAITVFDGTESLKVCRSTSNSCPGKYYGFTIRNGIDGAVVASPDFTTHSTGTTSFTDAQSKVWTVNYPLAVDTSGNGRDGAAVGGVVFGTAGKVGYAATFDGTNDYVRVSAWTYGTSFAWVARVRPTSITGTAQTLVSTTAGTNGGLLRIDATTGKFTFQGYNAATAQTAVTSTTAASTTAWNDVAFTYDGTNGRLYVNGVLEAGPTAMTLSAATLDLIVGADNPTTPTRFYGGEFDDARAYPSVLTAGDVYSLSKGGTFAPFFSAYGYGYGI